MARTVKPEMEIRSEMRKHSNNFNQQRIIVTIEASIIIKTTKGLTQVQ